MPLLRTCVFLVALVLLGLAGGSRASAQVPGANGRIVIDGIRDARAPQISTMVATGTVVVPIGRPRQELVPSVEIHRR